MCKLKFASVCWSLLFAGVTPPIFRSSDRWSNSGETFAYFCTIVNKNGKNGHIQPIILEHAKPMSTIYSDLIDMIDTYVMINVMFVLRSLKGRCYGNQLIWGTFCKHQNWLPSVFALEFRNRMHYRHFHEGINTSDNAATSHKNLLNFSAVTPEITFLISVPSCGYWAKIGRRSPFIALAFPNALDDRNVDGRI